MTHGRIEDNGMLFNDIKMCTYKLLKTLTFLNMVILIYDINPDMYSSVISKGTRKV